jgi:carbon monoxide dehydrogenase subunit G
LRLLARLTIATARRGNYLVHIGAKKPHVKIWNQHHGRKQRQFRFSATPGGAPRLMDFGGRYRIAADRMAVWAALNDPEMLKAAIPGCSHIGWTGPETLDLAITVNLGVVKPTFKGELILSNVVPAASYTLAGKGKGGLLGLAEGAADIVLTDDGTQTFLAFAAKGGASGQIMKLGKAVIGNSAQKIIDGFFERFAAAMGAEIEPLGPA